MAVLKLLKEKTVIYKQLYSTIFKFYYILDQLNVAFVKWHVSKKSYKHQTYSNNII